MVTSVHAFTLRVVFKLYREATGLLQRLLVDSERRGAAERALSERYAERLERRFDASPNAGSGEARDGDRSAGGGRSGAS